VHSNIGIQLRDKVEAVMLEKNQISFYYQGCWTAGRGSLKIPYLSAQNCKDAEILRAFRI
jgi:hypothetical protein